MRLRVRGLLRESCVYTTSDWSSIEMPELPEVEVTARGLAAELPGRRLLGWQTSSKRLRHPYPRSALEHLKDQPVLGVGRRAKYVLIEFDIGWLAVHLGMSGACRFESVSVKPLGLHDHLALAFDGTTPIVLIYHDPRRFGSVRFIDKRHVPSVQSLGKALGATAQGIEPLSEDFHADAFYALAKTSRMNIKTWLMTGKAVVGVGNIYACEALFRAGIHPLRAANRISRPMLIRLAQEIRTILATAIESGGSTLRDFSIDGEPGHFSKAHRVYDREGEPCAICKTPIVRIIQSQRSTFYCHGCQK